MELSFNTEWYNDLSVNSDEKQIIIEEISKILSGGTYNSCLEIGVGTSTLFSDNFLKLFKSYTIVEKEKVNFEIPSTIKFIQGDWDLVSLNGKYDVIFASHVFYYFNDKIKSIKKMMDYLNKGGIIIFVVNGKGKDYGKLKEHFSDLLGKKYIFTCDKLASSLKNYETLTFLRDSKLKFKTNLDLYNNLKLHFDMYEEEYIHFKEKILDFFQDLLQDKKEFIIEQQFIIYKK